MKTTYTLPTNAYKLSWNIKLFGKYVHHCTENKMHKCLISNERKSYLKQNKPQVLILMIGNYFLTKEVFLAT